MLVDAVFQGGGVKGIGFVGAVCRLEKAGYRWDRLAGTSAGAIVAALLASGYGCQELEQILSRLDYTSLISRTRLQRLPLVGEALGILLQKGSHTTDGIRDWLDGLLRMKGVRNFGDLRKDSLKIIAADVTQRKMVVLPDDLPGYGWKPSEFSIAEAVSMSASLPVYFCPRRLGGSELVDGGIYSNFPVWVFEGAGQEKPVLGFRFDREDPPDTRRSGSIEYYSRLLESIVEADDEEYVSSRKLLQVITIPSMGVGTLDFSLRSDTCRKLYRSGCAEAERFLADQRSHWISSKGTGFAK